MTSFGQRLNKLLHLVSTQKNSQPRTRTAFHTMSIDALAALVPSSSSEHVFPLLPADGLQMALQFVVQFNPKSFEVDDHTIQKRLTPVDVVLL